MAAAVKPSARKGPPRILRRASRALGVPLASVLIAFVAGAIIVAVTGGNPLQAYQALICGGIGLFFLGCVLSNLLDTHTPRLGRPHNLNRTAAEHPLLVESYIKEKQCKIIKRTYLIQPDSDK